MTCVSVSSKRSVPTGAEARSTTTSDGRWLSRGVGRVTVEAVWSGDGTVRLLILDGDGDPAGSTLLTSVREAIAALSPIGATVTVAAPTSQSVNVAANVTLDTGLAVSDVQDAVEDALEALFDTIEVGDDVILSHVGAAILSVDGVTDYSSLTLAGSAANYSVSAGQFVALGTVTLT